MLIKPSLFLASYAPLFFLLAIRFDDTWLRVGFVVLGFLGVTGLWAYLRAQNRATQYGYVFTSVRDSGPEAGAYLATYLLPFLTVSNPNAFDLVAYAGFFVIAFLVNIQSSLIQVNPMLYIIGYRVREVETDKGWRGYVIAPKAARLSLGEEQMAAKLGADMLFQRKSGPGNRTPEVESSRGILHRQHAN